MYVTEMNVASLLGVPLVLAGHAHQDCPIRKYNNEILGTLTITKIYTLQEKKREHVFLNNIQKLKV